MKTKTKAMFAVAVTLLLAAALFVGAGAAAEPTDPYTPVTSFAELQAAIANNENVIFTDDIVLPETSIPNDNVLKIGGYISAIKPGTSSPYGEVAYKGTIDLNGHTLQVNTMADSGKPKAHIMVNPGQTPQDGDESNVSVDVTIKNGYIKDVADATGTKYASILKVFGSQTPNNGKTTKVTLDTITMTSESGKKNYAVAIYYNKNAADAHAYDTTVTIKNSGFNGMGCGLSILGDIKDMDSANREHLPKMILDNVVINSVPEAVQDVAGLDDTGCAIYGAGYAIWEINNSELCGWTGIYAKSGDFTIRNSDISGIGKFHEPTASGGSFFTSGDAITIDGHSSYLGHVSLKIEDGSGPQSWISSTNGYAVREYESKAPTTYAAVEKLDFKSGKYQGGKDAIKTTDKLKSKVQTEDISVTFNPAADFYQNAQDEITGLIVQGGSQPRIIPHSSDTDQYMLVLSDVGLEYDLSIPPYTYLKKGITKQTLIGVTVTLGDETKKLDVKMSTPADYWDPTNHRFLLKHVTDTSAAAVPYKIIKNNAATGPEITAIPDKVLTIETATTAAADEEKLYFTVTGTFDRAGSYMAYLTFEAEVSPKTP